MLDSIQLRFVWLSIEQVHILPQSSDSVVVQQILEHLQTQISLNRSELGDAHIYVQSRVSLIRDIAEFNCLKQANFSKPDETINNF